MWMVRAEVSCLDSRGQVAAERGHDLSDSIDSLFDALGDRRTRAFGIRGRASVPATQSNGSGQLFGYSVHIAADLGNTVGIVKPLGLLQVIPQLVNPALVFCLGL